MNQATSGFLQVDQQYYPQYQYQSTYGPMTGNITAPPVSPSTKIPQISQHQKALSDRLDMQEKLVSILKEKLLPVMSLYPPCDAIPETDPGPTCPIANELYLATFRVQCANNIIQSLIDRVEV